MQEAIQNAFLHNFQSMMNAHIDTVNPLLVLHVNRSTIVRDTIDQVKLLKALILFYGQMIFFF